MAETGTRTPSASARTALETSSAVTLGAVALLAAAGPLVVAGGLGATGSPGLALALPLEQAGAASLVLGALVVAVAWPFVALAPGARALGLRGRALELALVAAGLAPGLRMGALLSADSEGASARAAVGLAVVALAHGLWLAALGRAGARRSTGVLAGVALALGLPLAYAYAREAELESAWLVRASAPVVVLEHLHGEGEPWGLAAALAGLAGAIALGARLKGRERARTGALGLAGCLVLAGAVAGARSAGAQDSRAQDRGPALEALDVHPLLGPRARPGDPAPLRLRVRAGAGGFEGEVGARGGGLLVLVPVRLGPLATGEVALPAIGDPSGSPFVLEARTAREASIALATPADAPYPAPIRVWAPLPGELEGTPADLARLLAPHRTSRALVALADLDLLAIAGSALDALAVPGAALRDPSSRARLEPWVAAGGTLATDDATALAAVVPGAGPSVARGGVVARGLGAGILLAPAQPGSIAALGSELAPRLAVRSRPFTDSLADALGHLPAPRATARAAGHVALLATLVAGVLALVLLAQRRAGAGALAGTFGLASLALLVAIPRLVLGTARGPVILETSQVLEAPSGGAIAGSTTVLRFASPRAALARVTLLPAAPVAAIFASEAEAARSRAELHLASGRATLEPTPALLEFPLEDDPALFFRRESRTLGGSVTLERTAREVLVRNGLPLALEHPLLVAKDGVVALPEIAAGAEARVPLTSVPEPFQSFVARAVANASPAERARWELLRAANVSRARPGQVRLTAFCALEPERQTASGVLEEVAGPAVLVIRD